MKTVRNLFIANLVALVVLTIAVFATSYNGRKDLVDSQRAGCKRGKLDRSDNARGWRNAEKARREAGQIKIADDYAAIATSLEARSMIDCAVVFPDPPFVKFK